ncbi:alpha/beta fold hydrolase, partial [Salmonella enterica]|uniref:alpha/beta fold hydrolase n=1 Tax=Salmonella enterica TaxID=28901 RepID=UPI003D2AB976
MSAGVGVAAAAASLHLVESSAEAATPAKGNPKAGPGEGYVTVKDGTRIYYKDWGSGQPLVFHHGWPLSADDWDAQMMFF